MGNTVPAALANLFGYYVLALPFGWWLTFGLEFGLEGIWWGLCFGLGVVAVTLIGWIWRRGWRMIYLPWVSTSTRTSKCRIPIR